ncbi:hypothetical protein NDU88_002826 [Pleurodeles waltl]|uniref:Uncharacterized protein n=1 Tax=Pleurodeles waltl TaxID=8319 RepID=A0AAV7W559_PLEWA|nr:hypothetical protein NDU88_002826 [Pleurodeles waltl]
MREGPIDKCPGALQKDTHVPARTTTRKKRVAATGGRETKKLAWQDQSGERSNGEDTGEGKSTEEDDGKKEESGERSSEAERVWETEFQAEDGQTPKDAKIARHIPGGTWLMQLILKHDETEPCEDVKCIVGFVDVLDTVKEVVSINEWKDAVLKMW